MSDSACRSELVVRERRGELSPAERSVYAAHLAGCESCRLSRQLGRDFEDSAVLEPGDGARIGALSEVARRWAASGSRPVATEPARGTRVRMGYRPAWRRRVVVLAAALPLFVAAAASAAYGVYRAVAPAGESAPAAPATPVAVPQRASRPAAPVARQQAAPPDVPLAELVVAPPSERKAIREARPPRATDSAAERFELANAARRSGDLARAMTLYRELGRDFPSSPEAAASELRLGSLLLGRGQAGAALQQFDRHLRRPGALVPEALYGRGRALAALDETAAERQLWTRMLREFSASPYAAHARRRLASLGQGSN